MLIIISPAKNMRAVQMDGLPFTLPAFGEEALFLARKIQQLSPWQLESLMKINPNLALKADRKSVV